MMAYYLILLVALVTVTSACPSVCRCSGTRADCSRALLTSVPPDLPYNTTELILRDNRISGINKNTFLNLKNLSYLNLQDNLISSVHSDFLPEHLQKLNLAKNSFSCFMEDAVNLESLRHLKELDLSNNNIESCIPNKLPTSIEALRLNMIAYYGNLSLSLDQFGNLTALTLLSLEDNNIVEFPNGALGNVSGLTDLSLARNKLRSLGELALPSVVKLLVLDLSFNELSQIDMNSFGGIEKSSLKSLSLSGNDLQTAYPLAFSQMPQLQNLSLNQNPWHCGCDLLPLREWLENDTVRHLLGLAKGHALYCQTPDALKGQMVSKIPLRYFSCANTTVGPSTTVHQTTMPTNVTMVTVSNASTTAPLTLPPDDKLFNFSVDCVSDHTLKLSWAASDDPLVEYQISWGFNSSGWMQGTSFSIQNLLPDTKYHICLMAQVKSTAGQKEVKSSCVSIRTIAKDDGNHSGLTGAGLGLAVALPLCCVVVGGLAFHIGFRYHRRKSDGYHMLND